MRDLETLQPGNHVQVHLGFPEYPNPGGVWKHAVVEEVNIVCGFAIVVTGDGEEVAAGSESMR